MSSDTPVVTEAVQQGIGLDKVLPTARQITLSTGEEVSVRQIKVRQLQAVIRAVAPLYSVIRESREPGNFNVGTLLASHIDDLQALLIATLEKDAKWVGDLEVDDMAVLFTEVLEVNIDFFTRKVLPTLSGRVVGVVRALQTGRQTTSGQTTSNV